MPPRRRSAGPSALSTGRAHGCRVRRDDPSGLPGLGQHKGGLSLLLQRARERRRDSSRHFEATRLRFAATDGRSSFFTTRRNLPGSAVGRSRGLTTKVSGRKDKRGRPRMHTVCGLLMHSSLATTTDGLPLGMAAAKFWSRKKFKGTNALKRKINPTRVPIEGKESMRWLENLRQSTETVGRPRALRSHLRPRRRHLGAVLSGRGVGHPLPDQTLFRQVRRRRLSHGGIDHGRGEGPRAALGRRPR